MECIDRTPYTYLIKLKRTGQLYCGVRAAKNCHPDDFWKTYFTSSKVVKQIIEVYGKESFETLKIITHPSIELAYEFEELVLTDSQASNNPKWLNRSNGDISYVRAGFKQSKEHVESRIAAKMLAYPKRSKEHNDKLQEAKRLNGTTGKGVPKPPFTSEHCKNISLNSPNKVPVCIDGVVFVSVKEAASHLGIHVSQMRQQLKSRKHTTRFYLKD